MRTGAGTRSSLALLPPRRQPPLRPRGPGETLRERAATFQRLRPGLGRLERVPAPRVPPGCAPAAERAMRAFGAGPASTGPRHPVPAGGLSGRTGAPTGTPTPDSGAAVSGRAAGGAAVRRWCQAGERRAPRRRVHGAGVSGRGRRALTFLGLTPNGGQREPQRGPSEWLPCCASLGNFSGIRSPRPGPSPFRNETCLPCRRKAMTVS